MEIEKAKSMKVGDAKLQGLKLEGEGGPVRIARLPIDSGGSGALTNVEADLVEKPGLLLYIRRNYKANAQAYSIPIKLWRWAFPCGSPVRKSIIYLLPAACLTAGCSILIA